MKLYKNNTIHAKKSFKRLILSTETIFVTCHIHLDMSLVLSQNANCACDRQSEISEKILFYLSVSNYEPESQAVK